MQKIPAYTTESQKKSSLTRGQPLTPTSQHKLAPQGAFHYAQVNRQGLTPGDILALQRTVGNRQVQQMLAQRADSVDRQQPRVHTEEISALKVMTMPTPAALPVQRTCACGGVAEADGECATCRAKRESLQHAASPQLSRAPTTNGGVKVDAPQPPATQEPAPPAPVTATAVTQAGPATCDDGKQMFCDTGNPGCSKFNEKGMTAAWANICYRCGPNGVYHRNKDEGTGVVRVGCGDTLTVTAQDNTECSIEVKAIDHGPRKDTGNLIDLHPKAAEALLKCANKKAKGKLRCGNFKMPVKVSATENKCSAATEKPKG